MSVIEQLVEMGFDKERAERAVTLTNGGVEAAMEWLIAHEGEELPAAPAPKEEAMDTTAAEAAPAQPGTYKCNDCGVLLRNEDAMMFHATKSGHENFSESPEAIKPLTEEEKKQKVLDLRERIKASRARKDEEERKEKLEAEKRRREDGKKMLENREKQKDNELRALADERRRAKQEEVDARQRVLEQIRLDKEARKARAAGLQAPEPTVVPTKVEPPPKVDYSQTTIQIRLIDGRPVKHSFGAKEPLSAVRLWLELNHEQGAFKLMTTFPRKVFDTDDYSTPLDQLGLVPTATIVMSR